MPSSSSSSSEFLLSGTAAVGAIILTNPLDVVRTKLQLQGELGKGPKVYQGIGNTLVQIAKKEGVRGLQRGLSASCLLQFSNVSMRFGGYSVFKSIFDITPNTEYRYVKTVAAGSLSGMMAAIVSSPFFLLKNRLQAQSSNGSIAVGYQHNYNSLREAFARIYHAEGIAGYYKGLSAFIPRVMVASGVQLSTYDVVKMNILQHTRLKDDIFTHFCASSVTGIGVVLAMQPFDFAATRTMNQGQASNALYTGPVDVIRKTLQTEGIRGVYKGALASYLRFGPYCVFVFVFLEQLRIADGKIRQHLFK